METAMWKTTTTMETEMETTMETAMWKTTETTMEKARDGSGMRMCVADSAYEDKEARGRNHNAGLVQHSWRKRHKEGSQAVLVPRPLHAGSHQGQGLALLLFLAHKPMNYSTPSTSFSLHEETSKDGNKVKVKHGNAAKIIIAHHVCMFSL